MKRIYPLLLSLSLFFHGCNKEAMNKSYKNPDLPVEERVEDLLSKMTLAEKAAQMLALSSEVKDSIEFLPDGQINIGKVKPLLMAGIGQITRPSETRGWQSQTASSAESLLSPAENAKLTNTIQAYLINETRLGIPVIFHEECLHGLAAGHATSTPQPIAMASSFDPELVEEVYTMIAKETRLRGAHQALTPVVDVARDARWGRIEETFGEDTYLVTQIGAAAVRGFQGDGSFSEKEHIISTLKHFAAHGQPLSGTNTAPANYSERVLREIHFRPFKDIIQQAGAISVMTTYHEIDGVPINANRWLVNDVLREEWGFEGFVVSDYFAIREMHERYGIAAHRVAADGKHAALLAIKAGVNIELPYPDCYKHIEELVDEGSVSMEEIDKLVGDMLAVKFKMGLFDDPFVDPEEAQNYCASVENAKLSLEAATKAMVLLENKANTLPLDPSKLKKIAVIGPNADRIVLGGYSGQPEYFVTLLEGIRKRSEQENISVDYAEGCRITIGGSWVEDEVNFPDPKEEQARIAEAVKLAKTADIVVLALGGNEQTSREAWSFTHLGDRASLELTGEQNALVDAIARTGKPIISFLFNGSPLAIQNLIDKSDAIIECWYLGQESGTACAKALFGDINPGGKLPISFPRSAGHIPAYYNHKPTARRGYINDDISPLYAFGYGLSYTHFEFKNLRLEKNTIRKDESVKLMIDITNSGSVYGEEVVQMYIRDDLSSVTRPVKELKDFRRIGLEPGENQSIELNITPEKLAFYDINMEFLVEAGEFTIMVGSSSLDEDLQEIKLIVE